MGVYLARFERLAQSGQPVEDVTYLRFAYSGRLGEHQPQRKLDHGIERILWLSLDEVRATLDRHRSPLVLQCIEDHARGQKFPLTTVFVHDSVFCPLRF